MPPKKTVINLSPASIRKAGTSYDLAIALAVLAALGEIDLEAYQKCLFVGELGLDGTIKPIRGVLPIVLSAKEKGISKMLPSKGKREGRPGGRRSPDFSSTILKTMCGMDSSSGKRGTDSSLFNGSVYRVISGRKRDERFFGNKRANDFAKKQQKLQRQGDTIY